MLGNSKITNCGFRELESSELALIAGGYLDEQLTDEYISFQIALQSLTILEKASLLQGMADAGMLPSPIRGGEGSEIIVNGDSGSSDPNLFNGSLYEGALEIILDLMRAANEQDRETLLGLLEAGEIDPFLNAISDGAALPFDTESIDVEVNIERPLSEVEQEAIEKLKAFIPKVTAFLNALPGNAEVTLENGQVVTAEELKRHWSKVDFRIDDENTQYRNGSFNSEVDVTLEDAQININIDYLAALSSIEGGIEWFILHEIGHFSDASLQDQSTSLEDSDANAPNHERMANEIAVALAHTFGINIYTGAQYSFDGDPSRFVVPDESPNSNGSNETDDSNEPDGSSSPRGDTPTAPNEWSGGSGGLTDPNVDFY